MPIKQIVSNSLLPNRFPRSPLSSSRSVLPRFVLNSQIRAILKFLLKESSTYEETSLTSDLWGFSHYWSLISNRFPSSEALYLEIEKRRATVEKTKELFRKTISNPSFISLTEKTSPDHTYTLSPDRVSRVVEGVSGTYFLYDRKNHPRFVIKPLDEEPGCINNPKGFATPFSSENPLREYIPLYESALREAAAFQIASCIGTPSIVPKTELGVLECSQFHDLSDSVSSSEIESYFAKNGPPIKEKLCSIQEFVPYSKTLFEGLQEFQTLGLSNEEIAARFDIQDFEEANLLIWTTYDTDAHGSNILVYPKRIDPIGNQILGLKKIDNGLSLPTENKQLINYLQYHPCASRPLSTLTRLKIAAINPDQIAAIMNEHGLQSATAAMYQRIERLKQLAKEPGLTIKKINQEMALIGVKKQ